MYERFKRLENSADPAKLLYEWVKTGVVNLIEFRQIVDDMKADSRQDGYEAGYDEAARDYNR